MPRHSEKIIKKIHKLRAEGKTYGEINKILNIRLAKSSLHWICRQISLPKNYIEKITRLNIKNLGKARATAIAVNKAKREEFLDQIGKINLPIATKIKDKSTAKIALTMLCLGEASKSINKHAFSLGNSNPKIITLFIKLLDYCFTIEHIRLKCAVQCRADQNPNRLKLYWSKYTGIPLSQFYKPQIDKRTIGKPTKKIDYKGVLNVYYPHKKTQLELESLAELIYNKFAGPVFQR